MDCCIDIEFMNNIKDDSECEVCGDILIDNVFLGYEKIDLCDSCGDKLSFLNLGK